MATDEVSRTFQELRTPNPKGPIGIAEGIFRLVTRVCADNQSMMRLSQRQMVGYKGPEKKGEDGEKEVGKAKPVDTKRPPLVNADGSAYP